MTPPSPEDSSLPPRQRQSVEPFAKNSSEEDLWDLADLPADDAERVAPVQVLPRMGVPSAPLPPLGTAASPSATGDKPETQVLPVTVAPRYQGSQSSNVARLGRVRNHRDFQPPEQPGTGSRHPLEAAFDTLEDWDLSDEPTEENPDQGPVPVLQVVEGLPPASEASVAPSQQASPTPPLAVTSPPATGEDTPAATGEDTAPATGEDTAPAAKPISLRPHLGLSKLEAVSLMALTVMLVAGGYLVYHFSLSRVLSQAGQTQEVAFPVRGNNVTISNVVTYWRQPLKTGNQVEAVRRGVVLIPVAELTLQGGPGAIRAVVHNDRGIAVGDPITRQVDGATTLILPATDGFEDISLHAAYRTGQIKPWTVHIFEAPSSSARGKDFKKLLEVPVSTEKR